MLNDRQLLQLNVLEEAGSEMTDGRAAIVRIVKNRMAKKFYSDGTITGTVLAKDQFSWAWFEFETVHSGTGMQDHATQEYVRCCHNTAEAAARAELLYHATPTNALGAADAIGRAVMENTYHGALYDKLTDDAVSYLNPRILKKLPTWAIPSALVCSIGHHDFYRFVPAGALIA